MADRARFGLATQLVFGMIPLFAPLFISLVIAVVRAVPLITMTRLKVLPTQFTFFRHFSLTNTIRIRAIINTPVFSTTFLDLKLLIIITIVFLTVCLLFFQDFFLMVKVVFVAFPVNFFFVFFVIVMPVFLSLVAFPKIPHVPTVLYLAAFR